MLIETNAPFPTLIVLLPALASPVLLVLPPAPVRWVRTLAGGGEIQTGQAATGLSWSELISTSLPPSMGGKLMK
jgi:hypothetical protein